MDFISSTQSIVTAASVTNSVPSGAVVDDLLIWVVTYEDKTSNPISISDPVTPSGWFHLDGSNEQSGTVEVYCRRVDGSEPASYTLSDNTTPVGSSIRTIGTMLLYRNALFDPVDTTKPQVWGSGGLRIISPPGTDYSAPSQTTASFNANYAAHGGVAPGTHPTYLCEVVVAYTSFPGRTSSPASTQIATSFSGLSTRGMGVAGTNHSQYVGDVQDVYATSHGSRALSANLAANGDVVRYFFGTNAIPPAGATVSDNPVPAATGFVGDPAQIGDNGNTTAGVTIVVDSSPHPSGVVGTTQLGGIGIQAGGNIGVTGFTAVTQLNPPQVKLPDQTFNAVGFAPTATLGTPRQQVQYNGAPFGVGAGAFIVRLLLPTANAMKGIVPDVLNAGTPPDYAAFQTDSFQGSPLAFQLVSNAFPSSVAAAVGRVGSVIYQMSYPMFVLGGGIPMTGVLGTVSLKSSPFVSLTGVFGTGFLGTGFAIVTGQVVPVTGVVGAGTLGTVLLHADMIFTLPKGIYFLSPMRGQIGTLRANRSGSTAVTGIVGTATLGTVAPASRYAVTGVQGGGSVGTVIYEARYPVQVAVAIGGLGQVLAGNVQAAAPLGLGVTTTLGVPIVNVPGVYAPPALSVAGSGGVGQVGFQISGAAPVGGVVGNAGIGAVGIRVDSPVGVLGQQATGVLGNINPINMPRLQTTGTGALGAVGIRVDTAVQIVGVGAVGNAGLVGDARSATAHVTGVQASGSIGSAAAAHLSAYDKRITIYTGECQSDVPLTEVIYVPHNVQVVFTRSPS